MSRVRGQTATPNKGKVLVNEYARSPLVELDRIARNPAFRKLQGMDESQNVEFRRGTGKKPLPEPTSVGNVLVMIFLHICRKIVLFESEIKVAVYLGALLCGSLVFDFVPLPRNYFSRKNNVFNIYFVKWGWAWTLAVTGNYIYHSTRIYCCGSSELIKKHLYRLGVATVMWFTCTNSFVLLENYTSHCNVTKYTSKVACLKAGHLWRGFDISGHAFILIYASLLIAEEAKSFRGWERIGDLIRMKGYEDESPLDNLSDDEFHHLKNNYAPTTPLVRVSFIMLTLFMILWDVMLVATIMYFHTMIQKVIGGSVAILVWFFTYKYLFKQSSVFCLPGEGSFKYCDLPMQRRN